MFNKYFKFNKEKFSNSKDFLALKGNLEIKGHLNATNINLEQKSSINFGKHQLSIDNDGHLTINGKKVSFMGIPSVTKMPAPVKTKAMVPVKTPAPVKISTPVKTKAMVPVKTPIPIKTKAMVPVKTKTMVPVKTKTPVPVKTKTMVPVKTKTPVPVKTKTMVPVKTKTPVPVKTKTPVPVKTKTPVPVKTKTMAPVKIQAPVPVKIQGPVPAPDVSANARYASDSFINSKLGKSYKINGNYEIVNNGKFSYLKGTYKTKIDFPHQFKNNNWTVVYVTRYDGSRKGRILDGMKNNWLLGHWNGRTGIFHQNIWVNGNTARITDDSFLISIETPKKITMRSSKPISNWINIDTSNEINIPNETGLSINNGKHSNEASDFNFAYLAIYDRILNSAEKEIIKSNLVNRFVRQSSNTFNLDQVKNFNNRARSLALPFYVEFTSNQNAPYNRIIYKRLTPVKDWNFYRLLHYDWFNNKPIEGKPINNIMNVDFQLFSSLSDAKNNVNPWKFCNFDDSGVGFPRDCGVNSAFGGNWVSYYPGEKSRRKIDFNFRFLPTTSTKTENFTNTSSSYMYNISGQYIKI